jgi:hypothetical protein
MPTILASAIVDKAEVILQDTTNVRWTADELLGWLNDAQREIALIKPDASVKTVAVQLVAGTKQTLGSGTTGDAIMLLKVIRNMGTSGTTAGNAIRVVSGEILDAQRPAWHTETPVAAAVHFVYDPRNPKQFYVYPPNTGTGYVEVMYAASPTNVATLASTISVDDVFSNAILDYVLYRAYSKDVEYAGNADRAVKHFMAFQASLGVNSANIAANNSNLEQLPFNPNVPGAAR